MRCAISMAVLGSSLALAANQSSAAAAADDGSPPLPPFQLSGRLGVGFGFAEGAYSSIGVDASYRVMPALFVGVAFEVAGAQSVGDYCTEGGLCPPNYEAFGPRVEVSPFPRWLIGPWLGAGFSLDSLQESNQLSSAPRSATFKSLALESTWDAGLEVRPSRSLALGPCLAWKFFLTNPYASEPTYDDAHRILFVEIRVLGRF